MGRKGERPIKPRHTAADDNGMLTWVLTSRGTKPLAVLYLTIACLALVVAASTWVVVTANHSSGNETLQLNITNRR